MVMNYGFGMPGMGGIEVMVTLIFVLVFGFMAFTLIAGISQWNKNNKSPRLEVEAEVVSRRMDISHHRHHHNDNHHHTTTSTWYYVTFQVTSGDRMEFGVSGQEYGLLVEGDKGKLTFQGTRYLGFERM